MHRDMLDCVVTARQGFASVLTPALTRWVTSKARCSGVGCLHLWPNVPAVL